MNIQHITVRNMRSSNGNTVPNQFVIDTPDGQYFQSYETIIAYYENKSGVFFLDVDSWDYSRTTGKYRNIFLSENKAETLKKIESGVYKLVKLNK